MNRQVFAGLFVIVLLVSGIGAGVVGSGLLDGGPGAGPGVGPGAGLVEGGSSGLAGGAVGAGEALGPDVGGLGLGDVGSLGLVAGLMGVKAAAGLSDEERALRVVELVSRHQVEELGLVWNDDVFIPDHGSPSEAIRGLVGHLGGELTTEQEDVLEELDDLPVGVRDGLTGVMNAFYGLDLATKSVNAGIDVDDYLEDLDLEDLPKVPVEGLGDVFTARLELVRAAFDLKRSLEDALEEAGDEVEVPSLVVPLGHQQEGHPELEQEGLDEGDPLLVCLNSHDESLTYRDHCVLLIDTSLEGNKRYYNNAGGHRATETEEGGASALIDFSGDNEYGDPISPRHRGVNGGAFADDLGSTSVGVLLSLGEGNGRFTGGDQGVNGGGTSSGTGASAIGFLMSMGGNDIFNAGEQATNGGAHDRGPDWWKGADSGALINMAGDDRYISSGDSGNGRGISAHVANPVSGLLLDSNGTNYYEDPGIPHWEDGSYFCLGNPNEDCGFEDQDETRSCWNCSVVPKGQGVQLDLNNPGELSEQAPRSCNPPACMRLYLRGDDAEGPKLPTIEPGRLLPDSPEGPDHVTHMGSLVRDEIGQIDLVSEPLAGTTVFGNQNQFNIGSVAAEVHLISVHFLENAHQTYQPHFSIHAIASHGGESVQIADMAVERSSIGGVRPTMTLGVDIPMHLPENVFTPVDENGNPIVHYNEDFDIVVPEGYQLQFIFEAGPLYALLYDSEFFPAYLDFPTVDPFQPSNISIDWKGEFEKDVDGFLNFEAGNPVEFVARGYNESGEFVRNVTAEWMVEPSERGEFQIDTETGVATFTPKIAGEGNITAIFHGRETNLNAAVDLHVEKSEITELRIHNELNGAGDEGSFTLNPGETISLYSAGFDAGGNFIEDIPISLGEWRIVSDEEGADLGRLVDEDGVVTFHAEEPGTGEIRVGHPTNFEIQTGVADIAIALGDLDTIRIQTEDDEGVRTNVTDLPGLEAGGRIDLVAAGYDAFDNYLGDVAQAQWSGQPSEIGVFVEEGDQAVFEPRIAGEGTITASYEGIESDPVNIEVIPGDPVKIGIDEPQEWVIDQMTNFVIRIEDQFSNEIQSTSEFDSLDVNLRLTQGDGDLTGAETVTMSDRRAVFSTGYCCQVEGDGIEIAMNATNEDGEVVFEGEFQVELVPGPLAELVIRDEELRQPGPYQVTAGNPLALFAAGYDAHGNEKGRQVVAWSLTEYGDEPMNEELEGSGQTLVFWPERAGQAEIRIESGSVSGSAVILVDPAGVSNIRIYDGPGDQQGVGEVTDLGSLTAGDAVELFAAGYDEHNNYLGPVSMTWNQDPGAIGSLNTTAQSHTVRFTAGTIGSGYLNVTHPVLQESTSLGIVVENHGEIPRELVFETQGENEIVAGETWPDIRVRVEDGFGNRIMTDNSTRVTLELGKGFQGELQGDLDATAQRGLVVFDDVSYEVANSVWIAAKVNAVDGHGAQVDVETASMGPYHIVPAELDSFEVHVGGQQQPSGLQLHAGTSVRFTAAGFDRFLNSAGDVNVEWIVSPGSLGTLDTEEAAEVVFTAQEEGAGTVTAKHDDLGVKSVDVTIRPGALDHVLIRDAPGGSGEEVTSIQMDVNDTVDLYVAGYDASGNFVGDVTAWWRVDPSRLGMVDPRDASSNTTLVAEMRGTGRIVVDPEGLPGDVEIPLVVDDDPVPPKADFTVSCENLECLFDASSSKRGDARIQTYQWTLGDGVTRTGESIFHLYGEEGEYMVTLNATDRDGVSHEVSRSIMVSLPPDAELRLVVTPDPENPKPGDAVTATALIENVGSGALGGFTVRFFVDGELVRERDYPRLEAGESMNAHAVWWAKEGEQAVSVEIPGYGSESRAVYATAEGTQSEDETEDPDLRDGVEEAPGAGWILVLIASAVLASLTRRRNTRALASGTIAEPRTDHEDRETKS